MLQADDKRWHMWVTNCCLMVSLPGYLQVVPHSKSGVVPMSSLLGVGQLGFWEVGKGGTIG